VDRYECRKLVANDLRQLHLIEKEVSHRYAVVTVTAARQYRTPFNTSVVCQCSIHAQDAIKAVRGKRIRIIPDMWENTYFAWMEDIKDWCISARYGGGTECLSGIAGKAE